MPLSVPFTLKLSLCVVADVTNFSPDGSEKSRYSNVSAYVFVDQIMARHSADRLTHFAKTRWIHRPVQFLSPLGVSPTLRSDLPFEPEVGVSLPFFCSFR